MTKLHNQELLAKVPQGLLINGEWQEATNGATFTVENPATGQIIATVASAGPRDAKKAMDAAADAAEKWAQTSTRQRAELLRRAFELVADHTEELATLMTMEMGKPLSEARGEVAYGNEFLRWFSEEAGRNYGRYSDTPEGNLRMLVRRKPVGPCFLITPWNFPLAMATRKIAPALAAGCTSVLKPAHLTPLTAHYFVQLLIEAGLPSGVVNVISGDQAATLSETIIPDPRLRKLSFTGSTGVGKLLLKQAADNVLRTSMELGGNAPLIVFADADIDQAVEGAFIAKMRNIGQACTAANRMLVHRSIAEEFANKLAVKLSGLKLGNGLDEGVTCGPLIEAKARNNVASLVDQAVAQGATVLTGGAKVSGPGYFYEPTVLMNVAPTSRCFREEIFGPVAPIFTFDSEDQAVAMANDTEYGLATYVFTADISRALRIGDRLEYGMVGMNAGVISNAAAPFGGVKHSGLGREGGAEGIAEYTTTQYIGVANPWAGKAD